MVGSMGMAGRGSGGIPGDIVATLIWVISAAIITVLAWPPLRRLLWKVLGLHALHAKLDHIILEHPSIANEIPGLELSTSQASDVARRYADTTANRAEPTELIFLSRRFSEKTDPTLGDS